MAGRGAIRTDTLYQTVTIPSTACAATLKLWLKITTAETTTSVQYDKVAVQVRDTANVVLGTLATYSNLNKTTGYVERTFDVAAWKGRTVRIFLNATEDASLATSFFVDDTSLTITRSQSALAAQGPAPSRGPALFSSRLRPSPGRGCLPGTCAPFVEELCFPHPERKRSQRIFDHHQGYFRGDGTPDQLVGEQVSGDVLVSSGRAHPITVGDQRRDLVDPSLRYEARHRQHTPLVPSQLTAAHRATGTSAGSSRKPSCSTASAARSRPARPGPTGTKATNSVQ